VDIRKEWESYIRNPEVRVLFLKFQDMGGHFRAFENLEAFILFMEKPSPESYSEKDACLWAVVRHIQISEERTAGLSLLTYLMSKGLQAILRDMIRYGMEPRDAWSDLWWKFLETALTYPLERRRKKVAVNLLLDTRHRVFGGRITEMSRSSMIDELEENVASIEARFDDPLYQNAHRLIEGESLVGVDDRDIALVVASRVYAQDLHDLAKESGLSYEAVRKRRQRAEKVIKERWLSEN